MPPITLYTRETCSPCKTLKWYLTKKGYKYEEKDIDDPDNFNEFVKETGFATVPLLVIGDSKIQGLNLPAVNRVLEYFVDKTVKK